MKVDKKTETEVLKVYETWLHSYLHGDVETYNSYFDDNFHFIGSTNNEEFLNRKDTTKFFEATGDQFAGKTELRNETKTIEQIGELIFITHVFDAWFLNNNDWTYYNRFRFTNTLKENKEGWRFVYQHYSVPGGKAQDGKTIGYDKINKENQELREAIQRRTVELEAKNRELEIEASLERVRGQAMAMRHSDDLVNCTRIVCDELEKLNLSIERSGIGIFDPETKDCQLWTIVVNQDGLKELATGITALTVHPMLIATFDAWINQQPYSYILEGKELEDYYRIVTKSDFVLSQEVIGKSASLPREYYHYSPFGAGGLYFFSDLEPIDEDKQIIRRFAEVFDLTYTRYEDLQKAEKQAREVQIELALEKVRSRSMAMQHSDELREAGNLLFNEITYLGIESITSGYVLIEADESIGWNYAPDPSTGKIMPVAVGVYHKETPVMLSILKNWKKQEPVFVVELNEKQTREHQTFIAERSINFPINAKQLIAASPRELKLYNFNFEQGYIVIVGGTKLTDEQIDMMLRFTKVFQQTYTRFLDLQNAEAQTREAKIEASLEKVRTVALTLTKSNDMLDIAQVLYEQLLALGFSDIRNAIIDIHNDDSETFLDYDYSYDMSSAVTEFSFYGDPVIEQQIKKIESSNDAFFEIELKGKQLDELIEARLRNGEKDDPRLREIDQLTYNLYSFGNGAIGISNFGILSEYQKKILKRFRNVFTFAYKRYTDLANAEAQAREAKIEAALEKVRSVALSMNESTDLLHIAKALYEQLLELGFNDIRNAIIDVNNEDEKTFLDYDYSQEMGGTITPMSYDDDPTLEEQLQVIAATTDGFSEMVLDGQQLKDLIEMRRKNGEADDPRLLKTDSLSYILYAFGNGAVGISNFGVLTKAQKSILDRFRNVFTFAYQRFKDLQVKEEQSAALLAEKLRLEKTLTDLQETQQQLIQSEKMASLGELTAGIAHEIQNPLNFVNNFSEVSNELIDEMNEEIEKGDLEEAKSISSDIKQNLEKINHHGRRADAIVKGMLQHSRKSTAEKEPTAINKLADEYLRLAYHGLRAKNKSFNATLETDFDESIGKINIIPQDMGRVILNLITNAFYACTEKSSYAKASDDGNYKPSVSVSTKKLKDKVVISVKDNGNGIPKHVVDKIFQPFFTTKPTGEGTGLGLSMSYDIITKGHGGELTVETKEGQGTTFKIIIPK